MSTHIKTFVFCDLIIENFEEHNFNNLFFRMNTRTKYDEIDFFEFEDK